MGAATRYGRTLDATLCEIERGVFYATYTDRDTGAETDDLVRYQIAGSATDAKQKFERTARAAGYGTLVWTETTIAPLFASLVATALSQPPATGIARKWPAHLRAGRHGA